MLEIHSLECTRGERVLFSDLSLTVAPGTLLRVNGPNGSGKTSLLRLLCGLLTPSNGEVRWGGQAIARLREDYWREMLYIGHRNGVKDDFTPVENLRTTMAMRGGAVAAAAAERALATLGLAGHLETPARQLSQGQCRRVALARLFLSADAKLWILDEPFTALDSRGVEALSGCIRDHVARGNVVVLTTHQDVPLAGVTTQQLTLGTPEVIAS